MLSRASDMHHVVELTAAAVAVTVLSMKSFRCSDAGKAQSPAICCLLFMTRL